ncbi:MAG: trigger factor family protein, partial [Deltaproteobacteria bacterium]|nr:trigger factor family protein [Deltaproteobacteria bacterium]
MINITIEEQEKLKRKLAVEVPLSEVQSAYEQVFSQLRNNIRINGFRPGKFPRALAEKRFNA